MSERTHIEWASHTASPWFGCSKVSPGCTNCYAETLTLQKKWAGWGDNSPRVRSKGFWKDAYRLDRKAELSQEEAFGVGENPDNYRPRMFTSLMDWLDPKAPIEWLADFLKVVHDCKHLDWLLLTKRPELFNKRVGSAIIDLAMSSNGDENKSVATWADDWKNANKPPQNVWFGVTIENQEMADKRLPILVSIPAKVRWLSVEPLLERVNLGFSGIISKDIEPMYKPYSHAIHWVVVGGESGARRRDCGVDAITDVVKQCVMDRIPVFCKQDCAAKPGQQGRLSNHVWSYKEFPCQ